MSWYHSYFFCHIIARNYSYLLLVYRCTKEWQLKKYKRLTFPSSVQSLWAVQNSEQIQNYRKGVSSTLSKALQPGQLGENTGCGHFGTSTLLRTNPRGRRAPYNTREGGKILEGAEAVFHFRLLGSCPQAHLQGSGLNLHLSEPRYLLYASFIS